MVYAAADQPRRLRERMSLRCCFVTRHGRQIHLLIMLVPEHLLIMLEHLLIMLVPVPAQLHHLDRHARAGPQGQVQ